MPGLSLGGGGGHATRRVEVSGKAKATLRDSLAFGSEPIMETMAHMSVVSISDARSGGNVVLSGSRQVRQLCQPGHLMLCQEQKGRALYVVLHLVEFIRVTPKVVSGQ